MPDMALMDWRLQAVLWLLAAMARHPRVERWSRYPPMADRWVGPLGTGAFPLGVHPWVPATPSSMETITPESIASSSIRMPAQLLLFPGGEFPRDRHWSEETVSFT